VNSLYEVKQTREGLRLLQHGNVLSELRTTPGPTHSVFDLLAAVIALKSQSAGTKPLRIGVLGFASGGMMAPLRSLGVTTPIETCDLDGESYAMFCQNCPSWNQQVRWRQQDAVSWLRQRRGLFDLLMDDLSVSDGNDVFKPRVSWFELPGLLRTRLRPDGWAVFNLMPPAHGRWHPELQQMLRAMGKRSMRMVRLDEFENRILVLGLALPSTGEFSYQLRKHLKTLKSRQSNRFQVTSRA
jgi:spermidine synthase